MFLHYAIQWIHKRYKVSMPGCFAEIIRYFSLLAPVGLATVMAGPLDHCVIIFGDLLHICVGTAMCMFSGPICDEFVNLLGLTK